MWRGARALRRPLKLSGPSGSASVTGRSGLVREASLEAPILATAISPAPRPTSSGCLVFGSRNKGFVAHKLLPSGRTEVIDLKESFTL